MNEERQPLLLNADPSSTTFGSDSKRASTRKKRRNVAAERQLQHPSHYKMMTSSERSERWGTAPDYEKTGEEKASLVGKFIYTWMSEDLDFASRAEFPKKKDGIIRPVALGDSSWKLGQVLQTEFQKELKKRGLWDNFLGQEVRLKTDPKSRGVLCWIGCVQTSSSPRDLKVGIDWIEAPSSYIRAQKKWEEESQAHERQALISRSRQSLRSNGDDDDETSGPSSLSKPAPMHNGTLNGEFLFATKAGGSTATVENPAAIRFLHQLYDEKTRKPVSRGQPRSTSLFYACGRGWGLRFLAAGFPKLVSDICTLSGPVLLEQFIDYLTDPEGTWQQGLIWAFSFLLVYSIQSLAINKYFQLTIKMGVQLRNACIAMIYDKCMNLSSKAQTIPEMSQGRIVNMVSGDVERLDDACWFIHFTWSSPLQFLVCVGLLYRLIGPSVFAGISVMFLTMPAQALITRFQSKLRTELLKCTDNRIKATNELFSGIRIVKFMVWENKFIDNVNELRKKELAAFRKTQAARVATTFVSSTSPNLVMTGVFLAYHLSGHALTPRIIFPTIALLNVLRFPFTMIPMLLTMFVNCNVSLKRIAKFLEGEDVAEVIKDPLFFDEDADVKKKGNDSDDNRESKVVDGENGGPTLVSSSGNEGYDEEEEAPPAWTAPVQPTDPDEVVHAKASKYAAAFSAVNVTVYIPSLVEYQPPPGIFARLKKNICCSRSNKSGGGGNKQQQDGKNKQEDDTKEKKDEKESQKKKKSNKKATDDVHNLSPKDLLSNVNLHFPRGKLTIVAGPTGCGKTTLLSSLLGEQEISQGSVYCDPSVAYVPQQPWILNATFQKNITFFLKEDDVWFDEVIKHCELEADIDHLINGISTEIGERGVTLSGGQKARVSLARAVYARKQVYLLDDPLSAVDAHVSEKLVHNCFLKVLANTTRILVTHQHQYIPLADHVVIMAEDGSIFFQGSPTEYTDKYGADSTATPLSGMGSRQASAFQGMGTPMSSITSATSKKKGEPQFPAEQLNVLSVDTANANDEEEKVVEKNTGTDDADGGDDGDEEDDDKVKDIVLDDPEPEETEEEKLKKKQEKEKQAKLIEDEEKATGHVAKDVYKTYLAACGGCSRLVGIMILYTFAEISNLGASIWLSLWSTDMFGLSQSDYLYGYIGIISLGATMITVRTWFSFEIMRRASFELHKQLLESVARAPMSFFDTTPLGRVLNRFAKDIDQIDNQLPYTWMGVLALFFSLFGNMGVMIITQPFILIPLVPMGFIYIRILRFFNNANRELKRVSSITKSPIFALLSEALAGMRSILAFNRSKEILQEACRRLDALFSISYFQALGARWLAVRLELMGNSIVFSIAFFGVLVKQTGFIHIGVGLLSLGVTLSLSITQTLIWLVRTLASVESGMNSVERISHYAKRLDQEETWKYLSSNDSKAPPPPPPGGYTNPWISEEGEPLKITESQPRPHIEAKDATIAFTDVSLRYRPGLPLALNNLSFTISPGEKVGIVGRTGSGKSTLMLALMRIVEICNGSITIGGVSTRSFTLDDLRSRFAMIPQDPILFEGTVRSNLDPFNMNTDKQLWAALEQVGMDHRIRFGPGENAGATTPPPAATTKKSEGVKVEQGLDAILSEGGKNFSVGQRQLLCLARAMLQHEAQFVLMDEATANIDPELDAIIQKTIRTAFKNRTVITIAHRLNTVLDADKVILLKKGGFLGEVGSPYDLIHSETTTTPAGGGAEEGRNEEGEGGASSSASTLLNQGLLKAMIAANGKSQEKKLIALVDAAHKARQASS